MRRKTKDKALILFGNHIKKIRLEKKLTQEDMDDCINFKHYNDIENGKINPTYLTLLQIAKALHCNIRDLIPSN